MASPPLSNDATVFWDGAFSGPTPPTSLAHALRTRIVDPALLAVHGHRWWGAWLAQITSQCFNSQHLAHQPWRESAPRHLPPRLVETGGAGEHPDGQWMEVVQAFHAAGVDVAAPLLAPVWGLSDAWEVAVALNWPSLVDFLADLPARPAASDLDARRTSCRGAVDRPGRRSPACRVATAP